jgi:hypothetical protein
MNKLSKLSSFLLKVFSVTAVAVLGALAQTPDVSWYNTTSTSFQISTADQLKGLANIVSGASALGLPADNFEGKTITLANDINLSAYGSGNGWFGIGGYTGGGFSGVFDGNGKTVTGLYYNNTSSTGGLFGTVTGGTVKNLGLVNVNYTGYDGGAVASYVRDGGSVVNCYSTGTIIGGSGVVGAVYSGGSVVNCYSRCTISGRGSGVVRSVESGGSVINCYSTGSISDGSGVVGYVAGGNVENCYFTGNISLTSINLGITVGGVVGNIQNSIVRNCYSTGNVTGDIYVGGVVGLVGGTNDSSIVSNCYSTGSINGYRYVGGVVGSVQGYVRAVPRVRDRGPSATVTNCFSTGAVSGEFYVGGIAGVLGDTAIVTNCVTLNPSVKETNPQSTYKNTEYITYKPMSNGRVYGLIGTEVTMKIPPTIDTTYIVGGVYGTLLNNAAFNGIKNNANNTTWEFKGADSIDGADLTYSAIISDGTLGGRFTSAGGWTTQNGRLPGFGSTVALPAHINANVSVLTPDRVVPQSKPKEEATVIAPVTALSGKFTAGPNPVAKQSGSVNFYRQGKRVSNSELRIYDATGNVINKVKISDKALNTQARRQVGSWNLKDAKGRPVSEGTYLVKGVVKTSDGKSEKVSVILGVR